MQAWGLADKSANVFLQQSQRTIAIRPYDLLPFTSNVLCDRSGRPQEDKAV